jgi:hypothetical protein
MVGLRPFSPLARRPYLSLGARPVMSNAPSAVAYADSFAIDTPQAADIDAIVLIAPISVAHHRRRATLYQIADRFTPGHHR